VWTMKAKKSIRFNDLVDVSGRWWTLIRLTILGSNSPEQKVRGRYSADA
jgi:hypothetical protein